MTGVNQRYLGYQELPEAPDFELAHFFTLSVVMRAAIQEHRGHSTGSGLQSNWAGFG